MLFDNLYISHFIGITIMIMLERFKAKMLQSQTDYLVLIAYCSSVFFHELAHFIVSFLLGGKPSNFTIIPLKTEYKDENGTAYIHWEFGSVTTNNTTFINALPIGLAPLLLLVVAYYVYVYFFNYFNVNEFSIIFMYLILYMLISNSLPSIDDLKMGFFSTTFSLPFYIAIAIIIYIFNSQITGVLDEIKIFSYSIIN